MDNFNEDHINLTLYVNYRAHRYLEEESGDKTEFLKARKANYQITVFNKAYYLTRDHISLSKYLTQMFNNNTLDKLSIQSCNDQYIFELAMKILYGTKLVKIPKSKIVDFFKVIDELGIGENMQLSDKCNPDFYKELLEALETSLLISDLIKMYEYGIEKGLPKYILIAYKKLPFQEFYKEKSKSNPENKSYFANLTQHQVEMFLNIHANEKRNSKNIKQEGFLSIETTIEIISNNPQIPESKKQDYFKEFCVPDDPNQNADDLIKKPYIKKTKNPSIKIIKSPEKDPLETKISEESIENLGEADVQKICKREHAHYLSSMTFVGKYFVTAGIDGILIVRDAKSPYEILKSIPVEPNKGYNARIRQIISIMGGKIACASADYLGSKATIWNLETGQLEISIPGDKHFVQRILEWPGNMLVTASNSDIYFWNLYNYSNKISSRKFKHKGCQTLLFHPKLKLLASSGYDIIIYGNESNEPEGTFKGHENHVCSMKLLNENVLVSGAHDGKIITWNIGTKTLIRTFTGHQSPVWDIEVLSDKIFCSGCQEIYFWNSEKEDPIKGIKVGGSYEYVRQIVNKIEKKDNKDERYLIIGGGTEHILSIKYT